MNEDKYEGFYGHGSTPSFDKDDNSFDERARAKQMLNEYKLGIKSNTSSYDSSAEQMDSMVSAYKRQQRAEHESVDRILTRLNEDPIAASQRRAEARTLDAMRRSANPTFSDRILAMIFLIVLGISMSGVVLINNVSMTVKALETEKMMTYFIPVEGTGYTHLISIKGSPSKIDAVYSYEYEGKTYNGRQSMSLRTALERGIPALSWRNASFTVYIDPDKPELSILGVEPYPAAWLWILIPIGVGMVIYAVISFMRQGRAQSM